MFENYRLLFATKVEADFIFEFASCFNKAILEWLEKATMMLRFQKHP